MDTEKRHKIHSANSKLILYANEDSKYRKIVRHAMEVFFRSSNDTAYEMPDISFKGDRILIHTASSDGVIWEDPFMFCIYPDMNGLIERITHNPETHKVIRSTSDELGLKIEDSGEEFTYLVNFTDGGRDSSTFKEVPPYLFNLYSPFRLKAMR